MGQYIARLQDIPDLAGLTPSTNAMLYVGAYASSTATWAYAASANSAVLTTTAGGIPQFATSLPFTVLAVGGGTGFTAYTTGDLIYANSSTTLAKLADVATGSVLVSGGVGVAPAWSQSVAFGTITTSQPFTITQTWNAGGVGFTGFKVNCTDTASTSFGSKVVDFQINGTSRFSIRNTDFLATCSAGLAASSFSLNDGSALAISRDASSGGWRIRNATDGAPIYFERDSTSTGPTLTALGKSDTTSRRFMSETVCSWATATDASRKARRVENVWDTAARECMRMETDGSNAMLGFYGASAVARQSITGSRGGNAALADLLTKLATLGLITDGTSA